jgi:putative transposase
LTIQLIDEAVSAGARREEACATVGLDARTVERWRKGALEDKRRGPLTTPANKLAPKERSFVLKVVNSPRFRDLSPNQIVPLLADEGRFIASESTMYRILRDKELLAHRGRAKPPVRRPVPVHVATGPNQVWSWDITYLKSPVRGIFYYLYMFVDVWSRKIVGCAVFAEESAEHAACLFQQICSEMRIDPRGIVLHADNGGPMKGSTMVATLERLGVLPSFSRPSVSDDNAFSEALFRTLKYRPDFPYEPFADIDAATAWVRGFVTWYNGEHFHSGIRFVTPNDRHAGRDITILKRRHAVYQLARAQHPERWSRQTRDWTPIEEVRLNAQTMASVGTDARAAA